MCTIYFETPVDYENGKFELLKGEWVKSALTTTLYCLVAFESTCTPKSTWQQQQDTIYFYLHKFDDLHCSGKLAGTAIWRGRYTLSVLPLFLWVYFFIQLVMLCRSNKAGNCRAKLMSTQLDILQLNNFEEFAVCFLQILCPLKNIL